MQQKFEEELRRFYKENSRKDKIIVFQGMIILVVLVAAVMFLTYQTRTWKEQIQLAGGSTKIVKQELSEEQLKEIIRNLPKGDPGDNGLNGANGTNGVNGINGVNGVGIAGLPGNSVTPEQIAHAVSEYLRQNPVQALVGPQGTDGASQEIKVDPDTCKLSTKYSDSDFWVFIAQLPKPCT